MEQCGWITIYFVDDMDVEYLNSQNSTFNCVVTSQWDTLSRNFTIASHRKMEEQSCPTYTVTPALLTPSSSDIPSRTSHEATSYSSAAPSNTLQPVLPPASTPAVNTPQSFSKVSSQSISQSSTLPTPKGTSKGGSSVGVIAGAVVVAVLVAVVVVSVVCIILLVIYCRHKRMYGPRNMYRLSENNDSFISEPSDGNNRYVNPLHPSDLSS